MKQYYFTALILIFGFSTQAQQNLWKEIRKTDIRSHQIEAPDAYLLFKLDWSAFNSHLKQTNNVRQSQNFDLPMPDGTFHRYELTETSIFDAELSRKYPGFTSFTGRSADAPGSVLKMSVSPFGIHAMILATDNTKSVFIDPITLDHADQIYQVYYRKDYRQQQHNTFSCGTNEAHVDPMIIKQQHKQEGAFSPRSNGDCQFRSYRLALACTGEYAAFHGGTIPNVLAAFNATMTRVNGVYERDLGVTMVLIGDTDKVIFLNGNTDPYSNSDGEAMLNQNQRTLDDMIGNNNYDIGHVFSTGGGGIAFYGSTCSRFNKGKGVTGSDKPVGDPFDIDYVSHEMGHQFGGSHTQNNNCNRSGQTAVEPGSASTIMGYAGICAPNVQSVSDGYFHGISIIEIHNHTVLGSGNTCATFIDKPNSKPIVNVAATEYTIPISTPFFLTAEADDFEESELTYCWEQTDNRTATMPPTSRNVNGPMFRSLLPQSSPTRYFPDLEKRYNTWEVLPSVSRTMDFKCTVRDNHPGNGCTEDVNVKVTTSANAGPFEVTHPNVPHVRWAIGIKTIVTWNVANTDQEPVNCQFVDILLSDNGGLTYPFLLASQVPNTGKYDVVVPSAPTNKARIMIRSSNNIFFDVSDSDFTITSSFTISPNWFSKQICDEDELIFTINITKNTHLEDDFILDNPVRLSVLGLPDSVRYEFSDNDFIETPKMVHLKISGLKGLNIGNHSFYIQAKADAETFRANLNINKGAKETNIVLQFPENGDPNVNPINTELVWSRQDGVSNHLVEVSHTPTFDEPFYEQRILSNAVKLNLEASTIYYWRVKPESFCAELPYTQVFSFKTTGEIEGSPIILRQETLLVDQSASAVLTDNELHVMGDHPDYIVFTITALPVEGSLYKDGFILNEGSRFLMKDIINNSITYQHAGGYVVHDTLFFSVADDYGRWNPNTFLPIRIKTDALDLVVVRDKYLTCFGDKDAQVSLNGVGGVPPYSYSFDGVNYDENTVFNNLSAGQYTFYIKDADDTTVQTDVVIESPARLTVSAIQEFYNVKATAIGGTGFLSYSLDGDHFSSNPTLADPGNGHYTLTVRDVFGCEATDTITVDIPALSISHQVLKEAICNGQSVEVEVQGSGGFEPYSFRINNQGFISSNLFNTQVPISIFSIQDAGGKIVSTDSISLNIPALIDATFEYDRFSVIIHAFGGTGHLSYSRNNVDYISENILEFNDNGAYRVYVRDSVLCSRSFNVRINALKNVNVTKRDVTCHDLNDGYLRLTNSGGEAPIQYKLNNGEYSATREWNDLSGGTYQYTARDSRGDTLTGTVEINNPDALVLDVITNKDTLEMLVSGGTPPYIYSIDNGEIFFNNNLFYELEPATYQIIVKDNSGCSVSGTAVLTSSKDFVQDAIKVIPNPVSHELFVSGLPVVNDFVVKVLDISGKQMQVSQPNVSDGVATLDVIHLQAGMYILELSNDTQVVRIRFVKI